MLHRAFSVFVFNRRGELLIHQRHPSKRLWPNFWSNSCCSHPRAGEEVDVAVHRRLEQELGLNADLHYVYKFEYVAPFGDAGTEHELCWVYAGTTDATPVINTTEIANWRWIAPDALDVELAQTPQRFTPWFKLEWQALRGTHRAASRKHHLRLTAAGTLLRSAEGRTRREPSVRVHYAASNGRRSACSRGTAQ